MIIYPPRAGFRDIDHEKQVIFLAGPIQGAPNWQQEAINLISNTESFKENKIVIANPRAPDPWHKDYDGQVHWETYHLDRACYNGVILFWLAKEQTHTCARAYAQTSRFELGEWIGKKWNAEKPINLAIGIEDGFSNERYIKARLAAKWPEMRIAASLEETVDLANDHIKWWQG